MLRVLIVEDNPYDVELSLRELRRAGLEFDYRTAQTEADYLAALSPELDVILCDFALPGFDGLRALALLRERPHLDIPFILVSATVGEENAVAALKSGAADYLMKDRLARLGPAVREAIAKRRLRLEAAAAQAALAASEERFRALIEHSSDAFAMYDCAARPLYLSPSNTRLLGFPAEELAGLDAFALVCPEEADRYRARFFELRDCPGAVATWETLFSHRDGSWRCLETVATNLLDRPSVGAIVVCYRDLTERKRLDARILRLTRMHAILSAMRGALLRVHDRELLVREACRVAVGEGGLAFAWVGLNAPDSQLEQTACAGPAGRLLPQPSAIMPGSPAAEAMASGQPVIEEALREISGFGLERQRLHGAGLRSGVSLPLGEGDRTQGVMVLYSGERGFFDTAEVRLLEDMASDIAHGLEGITRDERVKYLAYYDGLTGLPNRAQFFERIEQDIGEAGAADRRFAAILFDVMRFRHFNDMLGWRGGDRLLTTLADRLRQLAGEHFLARLGNDRFCVLLPVNDAEDAARFVEGSFAPGFELEFSTARGAYTSPLRVGAALFPQDGQDADTLLRNAEAAVAEVKQSKLRKYALYSPDMNTRASEILALEGRIRRAINRGEFELHYQPKVALDSGKLCGIEALIRWDDPELGPVPAGEFIPVLEETGLILEVGRWVLQQAVADHRAWSAEGLEVPRIAVNVSPLQLRERDFHRQMLAAAQGGDARLDIEITENVLMQDLEENIRKLQAVREAGLGVAIDDFGTGYSSLSCLARLPINKLKIDRSFVRIMTSSPEDMAIVSTIISLAHSLGFDVVAEGVETEEQARFLTLLRCDEGQGFLFERPLPAGEVGALLRGGRTLPQLSIH